MIRWLYALHVDDRCSSDLSPILGLSRSVKGACMDGLASVLGIVCALSLDSFRYTCASYAVLGMISSNFLPIRLKGDGATSILPFFNVKIRACYA